MRPLDMETDALPDKLKPGEAPITLNYCEGAQIEIIGPRDQAVLIDVSDPTCLTRPMGEMDILLTTHFHSDHHNQRFIDTFPGEHLHNRQDQILRPRISINSIASFHSERFRNENHPVWDNYIFVIETGGIRIAHFGDIGQNELTAEQLKILGRVDVAITQFLNPLSQMNLENQMGYNLMEQVRPRIIIPHHGSSSDDAIRIAMARWDVVCSKNNLIALSRQMLPDQTTVLIMGEMSDYMRKTFELKMWP